MRLLIVDDEPYIRAGIIAKIRQANNPDWVVVGELGSAKEAMHWLEHNYADICLTDIRMPGIDGLQLIESTRTTYPWLQWIIVSSYDDFKYAQQAIQLGVTKYILKPIDRTSFYETIAESEYKIRHYRTMLAHKLLVEHAQQSADLQNRWANLINLHREEQYPLLVVDTLDAIERWAGESVYLLAALAEEMMKLIASKVGIGQDDFRSVLSREPDDSDRLCSYLQTRFYFRLAAVMKLEQSMLYFLEQCHGDPSLQSNRIVKDVKRYLNEHYADKISMDELARSIPISRSYLMILFKKTTGETIWNYLTQVRMHKAKLLLADPYVKIYEIARLTGYENSEHFSKIFKTYCRVTPKEYRQSLSSEAAGQLG